MVLSLVEGLIGVQLNGYYLICQYPSSVIGFNLLLHSYVNIESIPNIINSFVSPKDLLDINRSTKDIITLYWDEITKTNKLSIKTIDTLSNTLLEHNQVSVTKFNTLLKLIPERIDGFWSHAFSLDDRLKLVFKKDEEIVWVILYEDLIPDLLIMSESKRFKDKIWIEQVILIDTLVPDSNTTKLTPQIYNQGFFAGGDGVSFMMVNLLNRLIKDKEPLDIPSLVNEFKSKSTANACTLNDELKRLLKEE